MEQAFAHCEALVRAADRDRFLATLFAPRERRGALFALYAFNVEIARVREVVRDDCREGVAEMQRAVRARGEARDDHAARSLPSERRCGKVLGIRPPSRG